MYEDHYHSQVKRDIKKIDIAVQKEIRYKHIPNILSNPSIGEALLQDLLNIYSYAFRMNRVDYRICYSVSEIQKIVYFLLIAKRENLYGKLIKRINP